ncbi:hypothetical protein SUGI_1132060 [Cryptomeria japonica]|uniref:uncharacterized protein LOC131066070 n=1 Tax=Cryptomeria japonica TaxID=3369 RepID=UPI002414A681|nr:uncharacterized protein LOC131066070 [Cryptomeria japonica]GLJ53126.1 hypothetical protein SUGI_1132060 [Cryptomeria japonica]
MAADMSCSSYNNSNRSQSDLKAYRASIIHSIGDPSEVEKGASYDYFPDGLLIVERGKIRAVGHANDLLPSYEQTLEIIHYEEALITPGFVDTHIHYPQLEIVGSHGEQLLEWLEKYVFLAEGRFDESGHAEDVARRFLAELLRNGTTTALVFGSVHKESVDAFFQVAAELGLRMIAGKVLMDSNAPDWLRDTVESGYKDSLELIQRWHGKHRLSYAVTPRFAITCSREQLKSAGRLLTEHPGVYLHTHLSENKAEIESVAHLFPERTGYLDVYAHYGLVGPRSIFAHGIHLTEHECAHLGHAGAAVAFCPSSNLFLGSGLLDLARLEKHKVHVGLATDIGAGTSFSLLHTCNEAYKVLQLQGHKLDPFKALYLATLGGARALRLDDKIGNFSIGKEADFAVLDYKATPLLDYRIGGANKIEEKLFVLMMLGDDRCVKETFAEGRSVYRRAGS